MIIQLIAAFLGSLGFSVMFNMKGRQIWFAGLGGAFTWGVYLITDIYMGGLFLPYFLAAVFVAVYAEIMARVNKAPSTIFLTATAVPLIPGGSLYYAMYGLVVKDNDMFIENGNNAVIIALAIALGFVTVAVFSKYAVKITRSV